MQKHQCIFLQTCFDLLCILNCKRKGGKSYFVMLLKGFFSERYIHIFHANDYQAIVVKKSSISGILIRNKHYHRPTTFLIDRDNYPTQTFIANNCLVSLILQMEIQMKKLSEGTINRAITLPQSKSFESLVSVLSLDFPNCNQY